MVTLLYITNVIFECSLKFFKCFVVMQTLREQFIILVTLWKCYSYSLKQEVTFKKNHLTNENIQKEKNPWIMFKYYFGANILRTLVKTR